MRTVQNLSIKRNLFAINKYSKIAKKEAKKEAKQIEIQKKVKYFDSKIETTKNKLLNKAKFVVINKHKNKTYCNLLIDLLVLKNSTIKTYLNVCLFFSAISICIFGARKSTVYRIHHDKLKAYAQAMNRKKVDNSEKQVNNYKTNFNTLA